MDVRRFGTPPSQFFEIPNFTGLVTIDPIKCFLSNSKSCMDLIVHCTSLRIVSECHDPFSINSDIAHNY